ncbi:MAG: glycerophosphodiester phosphodiesterase [Candidatus Promineifilaceae bacterium]
MRGNRSKWLTAVLIVLLVLAAAYAVLALLADPAADYPYFTDLPSRPLVIAHQGGDGLWPGDTMAAFVGASELGVDVLEMDMHSTADGVLVMMHDATVDRTTDGSGAIQDFTLEELKQLDAGYDWTPDGGQTFPYRGLGISVPTLDEVFTAFPDWKMNIEIKQAEPSIAGPFCDKIREYGVVDKVLVASFRQDALDEFRQVCPEVATSAGEGEVRTFFILNKLFLEPLYSPPAQAFQVPEYSGSLHVLTHRFVDGAHSRNLDVHAWTINEEADMQRMIDLGLDGIITDYPDRLLALLQR